jgi:uncharacterized circularly permuted ATP-grasp superfamily protein/uncharacterized alpha-E superfamily protein
LKVSDWGQKFASAWEYAAGQGCWDEAIAPSGDLRPHWEQFVEALQEVGREELVRRWQVAQQMVRNNAITYNVYGDARGAERLWTLDPIPFIIGEKDWEVLSAGIEQRAYLLNDILEDIYGPQRLLREKRLPPELVLANPSYLRPCHGIPVPQGIRLHFYGVDLARSPDGRWWVTADRAQVPSGSGYALENRLVSARTLGNVFNRQPVRGLHHFYEARRQGLEAIAPGRGAIVLLTPGPYNETYFEHSYLAKTFSIPLVEGGDLMVKDQKVYLKTLEGLTQVDVILRRQDDTYCDPLELRSDSLLGVPGLLGAIRAGNVAVSNALGSGLIETPAHHAFLAGLSWALRGESLILPSVATWWCGQPNERQYVLDHMDELIIKPTFPRFGAVPVFGAQLTSAEKEKLRAKILARPEQYIGQEMVKISNSPVWTGQKLEPRSIMLRAFVAWDGERYVVMPGGLTRVSDSMESLVVAMQQGGGSKDTWVLGRGKERQYANQLARQVPLAGPPRPGVLATGDMPSRAADNLYWLGRYTERVENLMRMLRSFVPVLLAEEDIVHQISLEAVLELLVSYEYLPQTVMGESLGEKLHKLSTMLTSLIQDGAAMTSLGWNLKQVRRTAWPVKDRLSGDTWRVLQSLELGVNQPSNPFVAQRPATLLLQLDQGIIALSAFAGLLNESTTRGHGWRFLEIGRRLERALAMLELVRRGLGGRPAAGRLELVLQIADSSITYRSMHLTTLETAKVMDLILRDETNPRSVGFQLAAIHEMAGHLPQLPGDSRSLLEQRFAAKAMHMIREADCKWLARPGEAEPWLNELVRHIYDLSDALTGHYLSHVMPSRLETY